MIRSKWLVPVLGLTLLTTACNKKTTEPNDEPAVTTMRLVVGTQTVNVNASNGAVTGGPIVLAANTNVAVAVTFLRSDGSPDPLVTATTFRMDATPANANVTFTRTGPFAGTLRGTVSGATTIEFALFHLAEGHNEFDFDVPVTVTAVIQ